MSTDPSGSQAVERALDLLKAFSVDEPALSLSELAERVQLAAPTARRLLRALIAKGFVEQDPASRRYRLGSQLTRLGHIAESQSELNRVAREPLQRLVDETGESAYLARLTGADVMYLMVVHSPEWVRLTAEVGLTYPAWATASGRVMLAELDDEEIAGMYGDPIEPFLGRYEISPEELVTEVGHVRAQGYAVQVHDREDDVYSIAAPVFDSSGTAAIALSISGPSFRLAAAHDRTIELVRHYADRLTHHIGGDRRRSRYAFRPARL